MNHSTDYDLCGDGECNHEKYRHVLNEVTELWECEEKGCECVEFVE